MKDKPHVSRRDIKNGLSELGLKRADFIEVHSSLRAFGYVEGGADTVIDALLETVGEEGTVIMPGGPHFEIGQGLSSFEVDKTPVKKDLGTIPETFRRSRQAIRSVHPKYSWVAIGARAKWFIQGQEKLMLHWGREQPLYKLYEVGESAYVLLLGVDQNSNSLIHIAEEVANVPYLKEKFEVSKLLVQDFYKLTLDERKKILAKHNAGPARDFNRLEHLFKKRSIMRTSRIGQSAVRLIKARKMIDIVSSLLEDNPYFLVVEN